MNCWRALPDLLEHEDVVLVTVSQTRGSAPREAGTSMLVSMTQTIDTIGGGHLEWEAMAHARAMLLQASSAPALQRLSLGASLGQCCGGVVWLVFERIQQSARKDWRERSQAIACGIPMQRELSSKDSSSQWSVCNPQTPQPANVSLSDGPGWVFNEHIAPQPFRVTLFGAGHVGAAIVRILSTLDVHTRWVDVRNDLFGSTPSNVTCIATDAPEEEVDNAPPGSFFLVLTHSHALDLELTARILKRDAFAWFGLIGSRTKRARFEHRLHAQGIAAAQLARMTCPIGVAGISDKAPQAIAIAVVAQLLQAREQYARDTLKQRELTHDE